MASREPKYLGAGFFVAIEFTGRPRVQLVAEIPREGGKEIVR